jgi:hypothetical protein
MKRSMEAVNQPAQLANAREVIAVASLLRQTGHTIESTIVGRSMGSTLVAGCRVRFRCGAGPAPLGSVVVVAVDGVLFAHRIVGQGRGTRARAYVITRGDATVLCDAPTEVSRVIGTVAEYSDGGGWRPVPPPVRSRGRAWAAAVHRRAMLMALELHVVLAGFLAAWSFRVARLLGPLTLFRRSDI